MSFFFKEVKAAPKLKQPKRRGVIPIESMNRMGCSVCELDTKAPQLRSPKMEPSGADRPLVYLLGSAPSYEDDDRDLHFSDKAGDEILGVFPKGFIKTNVRMNNIVNCVPQGEAPDINHVECCRSRIVSDIEATKPLVVVTVGDHALRWATGFDGKANALKWRGTLIAGKIGNLRVWVYPIIFPNYVHRSKTFKGAFNEYRGCLQDDIERLVKRLPDMERPHVFSGPYDKGIEYITGREPGDMQRLERALEELATLPKLSIDIETGDGKKQTGILRPYSVKHPKIWMVAVGTFERTVVFTIDHPEGWGTDARRKRVYELFAEFLLNSGRKRAHNLAMELEWFHFFFGPEVLKLTQWDDTMAMAFVFDEREGTKSLDAQTRIRFGFFLKNLSRVDAVRLLDYPLKDAMRYCGMDTKWTDLLADHYEAEFVNEPGLYEVYEAKVRAASTLVMMEAKGLPVDFEYAKQKESELLTEIDAVGKKIARCPEVNTYKSKFGPFDPGNDDHVLKLMRDVLHREECKREDQKTGDLRWTTDEEALSSMPAHEVPVAQLILDDRGAKKALGTYITPILSGRIISFDKRIHSKYSSLRTVTGRLAGEDPNPQNWPKRKRKEIRGVIAALLDGVEDWLLACDYGQIEFRVVGMASCDPAIVRACWTGYDVHKFWAERAVAIYPEIKDWIVSEFGIDWDEKGLKTLRQEMKNKWVFPQLFGSSVHSCATALHLPEDVTEELAGEFWDTFKVTKRWQEKLLASYEKRMYVETLGGQRRRGPMTKNEVINMPIQGTAAEIVIAGMNAISDRAFMEGDMNLHPNLNIHDDLTFLMPDGGMERRIKVIAEEMCKPRFDFINVPLMVEVSVGKRWHELEEIGKFSSAELFNLENPYA